MEKLAQKISSIVNEKFSEDVTVALERPDPQFGDFATNVAMQLARPLQKNPRDLIIRNQANTARCAHKFIITIGIKVRRNQT